MEIRKNRVTQLFLFIGSAAFVLAGLWLAESGISGQRQVSGFLRVTGFAAIVFFGLAGLSVLIHLLNPLPALRFTENGILNHSHIGRPYLIGWHNIGRVQVVTSRGQQYIRISLKDPDAVYSQVGPISRFILSLNQQFMGSPAVVPELLVRMELEEIVELISEQKKQFTSAANRKMSWNRTAPPDRAGHSNRVMYLALGAIFLILLQIDIFRNTFISVWIPLGLLVPGGFLAFLAVRKKFGFFKNDYGFFLNSILGTVIFGGCFLYVFMASNYYFAAEEKEVRQLKVLDTGFMARGSRRHSCARPFAIVSYRGVEKQLIFPCNVPVDRALYIRTVLKEGFFGFAVVEEKEPNTFTAREPRTARQEYLKLLEAARGRFEARNYRKSLELYGRAALLCPSDDYPKRRIAEIRAQLKAGKKDGASLPGKTP